MWDCKPCSTPLDPTVRLSKQDLLEVIDLTLHRSFRTINGCLSYLVYMTRPDLAFAYSQLSEFVEYPGPVHVASAERVLVYLRSTYDQGITYWDLVADRGNKLSGRVDSGFAADSDSKNR